MSDHVDHLLPAYLDKQLTRADASAVYHHVTSCQRCRTKLMNYEQLSTDLRSALGSQIVAKPAEVNHWWKLISYARNTPTRARGLPVYVPALLAILILSLPFVTTLAGLSARTAWTGEIVATAGAGTQLARYQPIVAMIPQPDQQFQSTIPVATVSPQETSVTAAPVPLAPSMQ